MKLKLKFQTHFNQIIRYDYDPNSPAKKKRNSFLETPTREFQDKTSNPNFHTKLQKYFCKTSFDSCRDDSCNFRNGTTPSSSSSGKTDACTEQCKSWCTFRRVAPDARDSTLRLSNRSTQEVPAVVEIRISFSHKTTRPSFTHRNQSNEQVLKPNKTCYFFITNIIVT